MLQGLRKKIGRYAPGGGAKEPPKEQQMELRENATPFEVAAWHFLRQDRALRRLETEMTQMIDRIQSACATMATVAEIFSDTCSGEAVGGSVGGEYKVAMKHIEQQEAERMEQSIRFTVLDPIQARLVRHVQLLEDVNLRDKLAAESKVLRAATVRMRSSRLEDDDKRAQTEVDLHRVAAALLRAEAALLPQLEDTIESGAASIVALFNVTRLQTAIFFRNTNQAFGESLSPAEREMIAEAYHPLKVPTVVKHAPSSAPLSTTASKLSKASSFTSDGWTEVDESNSSTPDGAETISGSDEDEESNNLPITIEDFEAGRVRQVCDATEEIVKVVKAHTADSSVETSKMVILASYPVVTHDNDEDVRETQVDEEQTSRLRRSTSPSPRTASFVPITPRRTASMFWSIRKTIRGKLNYATGETRIIRQSSAPESDTSGETATSCHSKSGEQLLMVPQSLTEWLAIEECLWEIDVRDARSPGKSLLTANSISFTADDLLSGLLQQHVALYFECLSYLRVEDLARLSKVNFRLHSHLLDSAPIWKKCIRSGGLSPPIRSSLWLAVFYEATPWRSSGIASHYLSPDRRRSMYDQLLAKVVAELADGLVAEGLASSDDDTQLAVWFREIDVDVVRTCHRSMHDNSVEALSSLHSGVSTTEASSDEDSVESVLKEMIDTIVRSEEVDTLLNTNSELGSRSTAREENSELEAKIRRVLRAYVVYNPRVGYCQGMGFLVRLLAEVAEDEADIFWLFVGFSEPENDRNLYEPGMAVLQPYLSKFELLFSTHMPELYAHFETEGVHVATFCTRWFLTFFLSFETLAPTLVIRLLDIFIIDGWRIMFSVSLVILDELQEQLLKSDMEGILRVLQFPRRYMPEPDQLRKRQLVRHALSFSISRAINSI